MGSSTITIAAAATATASTTTTTLHGTFTDVEPSFGDFAGCSTSVTCQAWWETNNPAGNNSTLQVAVRVDNVAAGNARIDWTGKPQASGDDVECTGSWSITVPTAHSEYSLSVPGVTGDTTTVPVSQAGQPIALVGIEGTGST